MTNLYRTYEIRITRDPFGVYFIVLDANGTKFTSGFFDLAESLQSIYQDIKNRIDLHLTSS